MTYRVTQRSISTSALIGLQKNLTRNQQLQQQLSSGKRVSTPSDDPSAASAAMALRSQKQMDVQYQRNANFATARLDTADTALQSLSARIQRARDLVVQANSGAIDAGGRQAVAAELAQINTDVQSLYNTTYLGRPVFGGTVAGNQAIDSTGSYVGNDQPVTTRISRDTVLRLDVPGSSAGASTLPAALTKASADVQSNQSALGGDLDALDGALQQVLTSLGDVGARANRLQQVQQQVSSEQLAFTSRISQNEDVDLPEAIMNMSAQQASYQAALGAASKIMQTSLVDFLK